MSVIEFEFVEAIMARPADNGIRLVGVDGPSGSGKTHLARKLAERLGAPVVEVDDFVSWSDLAGWWPRFEEQVITPLLAGEDARYQVRDWTGDEFGTSPAAGRPSNGLRSSSSKASPAPARRWPGALHMRSGSRLRRPFGCAGAWRATDRQVVSLQGGGRVDL